MFLNHLEGWSNHVQGLIPRVFNLELRWSLRICIPIQVSSGEVLLVRGQHFMNSWPRRMPLFPPTTPDVRAAWGKAASAELARRTYLLLAYTPISLASYLPIFRYIDSTAGNIWPKVIRLPLQILWDSSSVVTWENIFPFITYLYPYCLHKAWHMPGTY